MSGLPGIELAGDAAKGSFQKLVAFIVPAAGELIVTVDDIVTVTPFEVVAAGEAPVDQEPVFDAIAGCESKKPNKSSSK